MRAFVFSGGEIFADKIEEKIESGDVVIAADSGYKNAILMSKKIDVLIGDFDSLGRMPDEVGEIMQVPAEKDMTDTQLAVEVAIKRGADEIIIIGSTNGRVDHTLSLLAILESLWQRRIHGYIVNGQNRIRFIKDSGHILLRSRYKYFSIISLDEKIKRVSIEGAKYPLKNKELSRSSQIAVSNEILKNCALITVKRGAIYIIESMDI